MRVTIKSDGTPEGTHVLIDGKQLDTTYVSFSIGMERPAQVEVHALMYVDEIDVDGDADVAQVKVPAPETTKLATLRQALDDLPLVQVADTVIGAHAVQAVINAAREIVGSESDPKPGEVSR